MKSKKTQEMDPRCPLKLEKHPADFCPLAVMRLKALRNADKELTEEEENKLPGCPWALQSQAAGYCFFKFMKLYGDKKLSDVEIAHLNSLSVDTVKKIEKSAIEKVKNSNGISEDDL